MKFSKIRHIHFVGIGGAGMSGIAEVLFNLGYLVTGSDIRPSETTQRLEELGIRIQRRHTKESVKDADVVVVSSAVMENNPELTEAKNRRIPVIKRAEMLGELMRMKYGIGIAGTHGKTTTTSMVGEILSEGGLDPTIVVGGRVVNLGSHARLGNGEFMVTEADEYDRSFLQLTPTIAVVTTLEAEHLDYYKDFEEIKSAFLEFVNKVPFYGRVILCRDEENLRELIPQIERPLTTYGLSSPADLKASSLHFEENYSKFKVQVRKESAEEVTLSVPGIHNVKNSLAAIGVALELDMPWDRIRSGLEKFRGVHRRFEIKGESKGVMVVDDYAHHPTEIMATLRSAKAGWKRRIVAVFQPHLFSRTRDFHEEFGKTLLDSNVLVVTDIYPAREDPIPGITGELVFESAKKLGHKNAFYLPRTDQVASFLKKMVKKNDMVITLGAGDVHKIGTELLRSLEG
ncbi:MAG: UDP-N-acetylmuramate--alanine ligase [candidate division Zixibacteria bacterium SM23_73]|nr:MAG: UDP-N-acetylmuramate--alanine ligase [candidate division Zixibacteria bacterium SM23_73]